MIFLLLLTIISLSQSACPNSVKNQQELISLSLECFRQLYESSKFDGQIISRQVNERLQIYKRMLQSIKMQDREHIVTAPVIKWAQNENQIFISFKLSHRQDSPTCSDIRSESFTTEAVNTTDGNIHFQEIENLDAQTSKLKYKGQCLFTNEKLLFVLNLQFQSLLSKVTLRREGLGLYTIVGDKLAGGIWLNPFNDSRKAGIWPELRHKYASDMDKYFQKLQTEVEPSKNKRRKRPKPSTKAQNTDL